MGTGMQVEQPVYLYITNNCQPNLDLTVGWKSPQYQEYPSFVQKDDTLDKRKAIDALLQIYGSMPSIL